jgi:hypothetical protein
VQVYKSVIKPAFLSIGDVFPLISLVILDFPHRNCRATQRSYAAALWLDAAGGENNREHEVVYTSLAHRR